MFGFLKKLVSKSSAEEQRAPITPPPTPKAPAPAPASPPSQAAVPKAAEIVEAVSESEERLPIPYKTLAGKLPDAVQKYVANRSGTLQLPISIALTQLPRGEVKISLGQMARYSTAQSLVFPPEQANTMVALPLSEVLHRLKPEQFPKRTTQRKVAISEEIPDVFTGKTGADAMVAAPTTLPASAMPPVPPVSPAPSAKTPTPPPAPTLPASSRPPEPVKPSPALAPAAPVAPPPLGGPAPGMKAPAPETAPLKTNVVLPPPPGKPTAPAPAARSVAPVSGVTVEVPMSLMTSHFSSLGQTELANLHKASVAFPESELEKALKTGKARFPWKDVKSWFKGEASLPQLADTTEIDFPLNVVAPIFLQNRKTFKPQKKLELTEQIPDLFSRPVAPIPTGLEPMPAAPLEAPKLRLSEPPDSPAPALALKIEPPTGTPKPPEQQPAPLPILKSDTTPPAPKPIMDFGDIFGVPAKKDWTLNEVVQKCAALRGVGGAVITTSDGLLIAGVWPDGVKTESAAGFMPQMFNRVAQYSRELKMGDPSQFTLLIENIPLQIFRTGQNYFTILGKAGEPLPKVQLSALAMRLSQNPNQK